jgi:integrase
MSRAAEARTAAAIWRDAGMVKVDAIRTSFMRIMKQLGHAEATCPKSWRHAFATLLQDAGVDPLVRQITLGHQPINASAGALGMTSLYSHTPPETQRAEILRALRLWPQSLETAQAWAQGGG